MDEQKKQKLIIEYLLSSKDLYARCASILKSEYFDGELRHVVSYVNDYYKKYTNIPKLDRIEVDLDLETKFKLQTIDKTDIAYISEECEIFCRQSGIRDAIKASLKAVNEGDFGAVTAAVLEAAKITLDRDLGIDLYGENPAEQLEKAKDALVLYPTGIKALDEKLGGLARQQLTLFSANSGVGKSVAMSNVGDNFAVSGLHVLYISLELNELMVFSRLASIATGENIGTWKQNIPKIASKIEDNIASGAASYVIKRLKNGSNANDIRAYLKTYEMTYERYPDVIIVDYLDIMSPIGGMGSMSVSEQDKAKSEQLYEIGVDYNAIILSASQQNREAIRNSSPDQAVIAGGLTKINIVDNYISIYMTPAMRIEGVMLFYFLKTRSSSAIGENIALRFNRENLQVTDPGDDRKLRETISRLSATESSITHGKNTSKNSKTMVLSQSVISGKIEGLPPPKTLDSEMPPVEQEEDEEVPDDLLELMSFMNNSNR
jgi:replicative DNA helicase